MKNEKCGIYQIQCLRNGKRYVGSSKRMYTRWSEHRGALRKQKHCSPYLQYAWSKYGEDVFEFSILEECALEELEAREQFYIDKLKPAFNSMTDVKRRISPEIAAKRAATLRALFARITHCPKGHPYDDENLYKGKTGGRRCKACNAERVSKIYNSLTPEEHEAAILYRREYYKNNRVEVLGKQRVYVAEHKAEKRAYDRLRRSEANQQRNERRKNETPEQREHRLAKKRESYLRCKKNSDQPTP